MKRLLFAILTSVVVIALHAQDTTYYDANYKIVASLAKADYYKVTRPDSVNSKWTRELTFYKSGKIKSDAVLTKVSKDWIYTTNDYNRTYKEWYENGTLHKIVEYAFGRLNGKVLSYWENGNQKYDGVYSYDRLIKGTNYKSNGVKANDGPYKISAAYPGGQSELYKYLKNNLIKPVKSQDTAYSGSVTLSFTVNKDGSASDISIEKKIAPWISKIATDMLTKMPKWTPEKIEGEENKTRVNISLEIKKDNDNSPYIFVDQMPEFPGGVDQMMQFLGANIHYPVKAQESMVQGMVILSFVVNKEGLIKDIQLVRGIHPDCDLEAIRVVKLMPRWIPGKFCGDLVNVKFTLPIRFALR